MNDENCNGDDYCCCEIEGERCIQKKLIEALPISLLLEVFGNSNRKSWNELRHHFSEQQLVQFCTYDWLRNAYDDTNYPDQILINRTVHYVFWGIHNGPGRFAAKPVGNGLETLPN